jgi:hypothetical protein
LNRSVVLFRLTGLLATLVVSACWGRNPDDANAQDAADTVGTAQRLVVVSAPKSPYRVVSRSDTGSVSGSVHFEGAPIGDTLLQIDAEQNGCNKPLTIKRLERKDGKVVNAVVWLTDIREGRELPLKRRFELRNRDCAWDPMVQVVIAGGTINLFNEDPLVEQANIIEISTGDTVGVAPFTDGGQVIPYGKLIATPRAYEFSIESRPMSRAWVIALDHPYTAVTKANGAFTISGIPAGKYTLRVWHPMLGILDTKINIQSGQTTEIQLHFPSGVLDNEDAL